MATPPGVISISLVTIKREAREAQAALPVRRRLNAVTSLLCAAAVLNISSFLPGAAAVTVAKSAWLFSGSLTWSIDPGFVDGKREVEFTLDTAFDMDLRNLNCSYTVGEKVQCFGLAETHWGRLCLDQYQRTADDTLVARPLSKYDHEKDCDGVNNVFTVQATYHSNGVNLVYGRLVHRVTVEDPTFVLIGFLAAGRESLPESPASTGNAGVLLPQCDTNMTQPTQLPCSVNTHSTDYNSTRLPEFGVLKTAFNEWQALRPKGLSYLENIEVKELYERFPSLETVVPLCAAAATNEPAKCKCSVHPCLAWHTF